MAYSREKYQDLNYYLCQYRDFKLRRTKVETFFLKSEENIT